MKLPSLAMLLCLRDEEDFLPHHLAYHQALGVTRAYAFLDRCADATAAIARGHPWVEIIEEDRDPAREQLAIYQCRCANQALERARRDGFDWLLHIDVDEFAWGDNPGGRSWFSRSPTLRERGSLTAVLARVQPKTQQVLLRPLEAVPQKLADERAFWKLHYFQDGGVMPRPVLDPLTGEVHLLDRWLGHSLGKSIVRTSAPVTAINPHRWGSCDGAEPATEWLGWHYHFVITGARHWQVKYRKLSTCPDRWPRGAPVRFPKQSWKQASVTLSDEAARLYFDEWVAMQPTGLAAGLTRGIIVQDATVERLLKAA